MNRFEQAYGKIDKEVVEKTNELTTKLQDINTELKKLNIPVRVFSKTTEESDNWSKENQFYFRDTVDAINFLSDF